jgi:hypothetical protein
MGKRHPSLSLGLVRTVQDTDPMLIYFSFDFRVEVKRPKY